ncbi:Carnosine N-methyltransferase [Pseudocercospora fuligena]|uniref:carnosine N-methyltransferase n=1 Tax=Pseudocercospora fuligena TaxID=685502 RepID=A0A8H6RN56_9PEZI|nr:Carnosine N-methyltransferase [Pseudocercospora fuligena]
MAAPEEQLQDTEFDPLADPEERQVVFAALDSYRQYRRAAHYNITHLRRQSFYALPASQVDLLSSPPFCLPKVFDRVDEAIDSNAKIAEAILDFALPSFGLEATDDTWKTHSKPSDLDKARSTIRQLYRDWSAEGLPERHAAFSPIMGALSQHFQCETEKRSAVRILVPGAGLGRLVFDLCAAGYTVEGNEISYHQLTASNYILNSVRKAGQHTLYPWALNFSNHHTRSAQLQSVAIPDINPAMALEQAQAESRAEVHHSERMSMTSGDFCVLYQEPEYLQHFDAVTTCFFLDTAPNVISYIETIKACLKTGGIWINLGPLLWHFESAPLPGERQNSGRTHSHTNGNQGIGEPGSFELSNEEVVALVASLGFEMLEQKIAPATGYIHDPASMLQNVYRPVLWVARKT